MRARDGVLIFHDAGAVVTTCNFGLRFAHRDGFGLRFGISKSWPFCHVR
jgi:hypothetical protein